MAEELIKDVISTGVDPLTLERQHVDMYIHYLNPTNESGAVSVAHAQEVIYNDEIVTRLLRGIEPSFPFTRN